MRIPSGVTDQYIYFVAVDATDLKTRETGLSGFTVYRSRNGGAAASYTTPTVNETDSTNMPGVYELLLDEDMTLDAGDQSQEVCLHITQASMAPVTRVFELYRPSVTAGETIGVSGGAVTAVTTATNLTNLPAITANWLTSAGIAASALNGKGDWNIGKTGYALSAAGVQAIWDALTSALTTAGSIGKKLADWVIGTTQTGDSFARLGAPTGASVSADIAALPTAAANATAVLTTAITESYAADGAAPTLAQALCQLLGRNYEFAISGDTLTVKKLDGSTTAMTFTLAPAGGPYTSITRAS